MKVPITHYFYFWFMNSMMAFGMGFVIGYMSSPVIMAIFKIPDDAQLELIFHVSLCFLFIDQIIMPIYFWGKRRGEFEYSFLEKSASNRDTNPGLSIRLKEVKKELKFADLNSAHGKLVAATKEFPSSFVVHFMYALSCERLDLAEAAIEAYETARKLLPESAQVLNTYVEKQIRRVKLYGPSNISTAPGLQYLMY
jgi:hypothetical protein